MERDGLRRFMISFSAMLVITSALFLWNDDSSVSAHSAQSVELRYIYSEQTLNVTITHQVPIVPLDEHYIEEVTVSKNGALVIEETYDSQPTRDTFSYEYLIDAEDGDVLEVYTKCNLAGENTNEITVQAPRDRMTMSVQPDTITYIEMGEQQDFTMLVENMETNNPVEGAVLEVRADIGEVSEAMDLGIGAYQFTYTAPVLDDEDIEVINITATNNGYHNSYFEFSFDVTYPLDPDFVLVVDISPASATIKERESKDFSVIVKTESGKSVDIDELLLGRSGGDVIQVKNGPGEFTVTFTAKQRTSDATGFLTVTAEKEGYQKGYRKVMITLLDTSSSDDDDDDTSDDDTDVTNSGGLLQGNNIIALIVVIIIVVLVIGFIVYRKMKTKRIENEYEAVQISPEYYEK